MTHMEYHNYDDADRCLTCLKREVASYRQFWINASKSPLNSDAWYTKDIKLAKAGATCATHIHNRNKAGYDKAFGKFTSLCMELLEMKEQAVTGECECGWKPPVPVLRMLEQHGREIQKERGWEYPAVISVKCGGEPIGQRGVDLMGKGCGKNYTTYSEGAYNEDSKWLYSNRETLERFARTFTEEGFWK